MSCLSLSSAVDSALPVLSISLPSSQRGSLRQDISVQQAPGFSIQLLLQAVLAEEQEQAEDAAEKVRVEQRGEHGGPKGEEPTRFGDWEKGGRCYDF
ncbi:hypothetical protein WJX82_004718 [Trebouxia sp. C0006]